MIHMLTAIGLSPSGHSTVHIYSQTVRRTTQFGKSVARASSFTLAFALQLRKNLENPQSG